MSSEAAATKVSTSTGNPEAGHINEFTEEDRQRIEEAKHASATGASATDASGKNQKSASQGVSDGIKGIFNVAHGAGELIRGHVNGVADKAGEGLASHGKTVETDEERQANLAATGHTPRDHSQSVEDGKTQIVQGIDAIKKIGSGEKTNNA